MNTSASQAFIPMSRLKKMKNYDFRFKGINFVVLMLIIAAGAIVQNMLPVPSRADAVVRPDIMILITGLVIGTIMMARPTWSTVIGLAILIWIKTQVFYTDHNLWPMYLSCYTGMLIATSIQIAQQWEKGIILRLGKFRTLNGPGFFMIVPLIDRVDRFIDHRVRSTDFRAETTLTRDTVPVNVDAIAFWLVWDAKMSVLEVEDYESAVILSAQTALRDAIGRHNLAEMLEDREQVGHEIQKVIDKKTDPWGITIQTIEIRDIVIPKGLEDAMSRQAQAERERQSRVILGTAETEIAKKFEEASRAYQGNPTALHLRAMNMVFEGLKQKGSMIIVPSSALDTMSLGAIGGLTSFAQTNKEICAGANDQGEVEVDEPGDQQVNPA